MIDLKLTIPKAYRLGEQRGDVGALADAFEMCRVLENTKTISVSDPKDDDLSVFDQDNFRFAHRYSKLVRGAAARLVKERGLSSMLELYYKSLLFDAPHDFDSACLFAEFERPSERKFYEPRRKQLLPLVSSLQALEDGELELLCLSLPPGVGKTTLAIMFLCWTGLRHPEKQNLGGSHSNSFLRGVYDEIGRMLDPSGEYLWREIFPQVEITSRNAKDMRMDLGLNKRSSKRFETFEFSSIGSANAGKVRCSNLLYCDDLVEGIEQALSRDRMEKLWQQYYTDFRQRKIGNCKELHIATRWSLHDVIGKLKLMYEDDPKAEFIEVPAMNEHDESNFDYPYGLGFTTEFYRAQREIMDEPSWRALYMNEPIEREGQLYSIDDFQRYAELPNGDPDAILAVCDTKTTGTDFCVLIIAYQYGTMFFIEDVVCENYAPDIVENSLVQMLVKHNPHMARFESNVAGGKLAQIVQERIKAQGARTKITAKWTQSNKETKIQVNSPWVKQHCVFKFAECVKGSEWKEYRQMLQMLCSYTLAGNNKHDDVPDAFAQLAEYAQSFNKREVKLVKRFF